MNRSIKSVIAFGKGRNDGALGGLKTLSKDDIVAQTKCFSSTNEFDSWQVKTEDDDHNNYIEEYE